MKKSPNGRIALCGLILALAASDGAGAQTISLKAATGNGAEVERLHEQAQTLYTRPHSYSRAALLLDRAADLQSMDESGRVFDRALAARLWYYSGSRTVARNTMRQAAEEALQQGAIARAAQLYLDACFIAIEQNKHDAAYELHAAAVRLARSQHLASSDRSWLETRLLQVSSQLATR